MHVPCGTVVFEVHKVQGSARLLVVALATHNHSLATRVQDVVSAPPTLMEAGELVDPDDDFVWDGDEWAAAFGPTLYVSCRGGAGGLLAVHCSATQSD